MVNTSLLKQAQTVALKNLRACYQTNGIIAGQHHFTDYWGRDGYFAAFGALAAGDDEVVKKMVKIFLSFQREDGLIPYRVMRGPVTIGKYLGRPKFYKTPRPTYRLRQIGPVVLDGATLTLIFFALLGLKKRWPSHFDQQIQKALNYLKTQERHGLLWEGVMTEWHDSVWKYGNLLYCNVIYWQMYGQLAAYYQKIKNPIWKTLIKKQTAIGKALRQRLWTGEFFADWHDYKRQDYFNAFGNLMAIAWGLTTPVETESIMKKTQTVKIDFTLETNVPKYPWWRVDLVNRLGGVSDYQNYGLLWWQPSAAYLLALVATNQRAEAERWAEKISRKLVKDKLIYEIYERDGQPANRLTYKSETPFAWSAGMLFDALEKFGKLNKPR